MIKLIACDLDETLLNDDKKICERNLKAIRKAREEYGVKFVIASGRSCTRIEPILETLCMLHQPNEYIIGFNGGMVCECKDYKRLAFHALPFAKAKELVAYGKSIGICVEVFTEHHVYSFNMNDDERENLKKYDFIADECEGDIDFLKDTAIIKVLFVKPDMDYLKQVADGMKELTQGVYVSFSSGRYLEFNREGVNKGLGLSDLAGSLGIAMKETMAIGDNYNDVGMLKVAGTSVAMVNAHDDIKAVSSYVTQANHNDGGVAEAIERFVFTERKAV